MSINNILFCVAIYIFIIFVAFFIICYRSAKKNGYGQKGYTYEIEASDVVGSILWPMTLIILMCIVPFEIIIKLALKAKMVANPDEFKINK